MDLGLCRLIEDPEQAAGPRAGVEGRTPQRRHAGRALRPGHDAQEPSGHAQADPLGLGDGGELVVLVGGDLDGALQPFLEGSDLGPLLGELSPKSIDPGFDRGAVDGFDDLLGFAVERLS